MSMKQSKPLLGEFSHMSRGLLAQSNGSGDKIVHQQMELCSAS